MKKRIPYLLHHGMRALMVLAFLFFVLTGNWFNAFNTVLIFLLMMAPSVLKKRYDFYLPFELEVAIVAFIFVSVFIGSLQNYFQKFPLMDAIIHFHSGILLGIVGFVLVYVLNDQKNKKLELSPGFISFFAVTFSIAMGAVWEIFEFFMDTFFAFNLQESGIPDTMGDIIVNAIGAVIVGVLGYLCNTAAYIYRGYFFFWGGISYVVEDS